MSKAACLRVFFEWVKVLKKCLTADCLKFISRCLSFMIVMMATSHGSLFVGDCSFLRLTVCSTKKMRLPSSVHQQDVSLVGSKFQADCIAYRQITEGFSWAEAFFSWRGNFRMLEKVALSMTVVPGSASTENIMFLCTSNAHLSCRIFLPLRWMVETVERVSNSRSRLQIFFPRRTNSGSNRISAAPRFAF